MAILCRRALALDKFTRNALSASIHARESRHARDFFSNTPGKQLLKGREVIKLCEEEDMFLYDRLQTHEDYKPAVCDVFRKVSKLQDVLTYYGSVEEGAAALFTFIPLFPVAPSFKPPV